MSFIESCLISSVDMSFIESCLISMIPIPGELRGQCWPGSGDGSPCHLPAGLHHLLCGGSQEEGGGGAREPGHRIVSERRRAHGGETVHFTFTDCTLHSIFALCRLASDVSRVTWVTA